MDDSDLGYIYNKYTLTKTKGYFTGSAHESLVLIAYAQMPHRNAHADVSSTVSDLNLSLSLHLHPYFVLRGQHRL